MGKNRKKKKVKTPRKANSQSASNRKETISKFVKWKKIFRPPTVVAAIIIVIGGFITNAFEGIVTLLKDEQIQPPLLYSVQPLSITVQSIERAIVSVTGDGNQISLPLVEVSVLGKIPASGLLVTMTVYQNKMNSRIIFKRIKVPFSSYKQLIDIEKDFPDGLPVGNYTLEFSVTDSIATATEKYNFQHYFAIRKFNDGDAILHDNSRIKITNSSIRMSTDSNRYCTAEMKHLLKIEDGDTILVTGVINKIEGQPRFQVIIANKNTNNKKYAEKLSALYWEDSGYQERSAKLILGRSIYYNRLKEDENGNVLGGDIKLSYDLIPKPLTHAYLDSSSRKFHFAFMINARRYESIISCYLAESKITLLESSPICRTRLNTNEYPVSNLVDMDICILFRANMKGVLQVESAEIYKIPNTPSYPKSQIKHFIQTNNN